MSSAERLLARASGVVPLSWLVRLSGERVYRPMYHSVQGDYPLPHIRHLYAVHPVARFERDLDLLLRHFEPVSLDELPAVLERGTSHGRPKLLLSFDDGLREVHDVALPVLRAKGVPAIVFVNSAFVGNRALFFRYLASALIAHLEERSPGAATLSELVRIARGDGAVGGRATAGAEADAGAGWRAALLGVPYAQRAALEEIAALVGFDIPEFLARQRPYMDVAQLERLRAEGFAIGAHSIDHPLYREIGLDEQLRQTRESCAYVRETFAQRDCTFAFPFSDAGVPASFFERVRDEGIASRVFGGRGYRLDHLPTTVHRHSIEGREGSMGDLLRVDHLMSIVRRMLRRERVLRH